MASRLGELFEDAVLKEKIKKKLPFLFNIAELESSRAGKVGMEVGSLRERILIALLIYKFREANVEKELPITSPELDIRLFGSPVSIKTITGVSGVKVIWTVDAKKAREFYENYEPSCDVLLAQIKWEMQQTEIARGKHPGGLFLIPVEVQQRVLQELGKDNYLKLPKVGTNPRGVEISKEGVVRWLTDKETKSLPIVWTRVSITYDPYKRWVDYWKDD